MTDRDSMISTCRTIATWCSPRMMLEDKGRYLQMLTHYLHTLMPMKRVHNGYKVGTSIYQMYEDVPHMAISDIHDRIHIINHIIGNRSGSRLQTLVAIIYRWDDIGYMYGMSMVLNDVDDTHRHIVEPMLRDAIFLYKLSLLKENVYKYLPPTMTIVTDFHDIDIV